MCGLYLDQRLLALADDPLRATTLAVVGTNVALTKMQLTKLVMVAVRDL
jgi:L-aminopeptidase/D-esterase-like protein